MRARARSQDPATSHAAAVAVELEGRAGSQRRDCLEVVRTEPGLTAAEIAVRLGIERHVPSRRLPELRDAGLVENPEGQDGKPICRRCRIVGRPSMIWDPIVPGPSQPELFS